MLWDIFGSFDWPLGWIFLAKLAVKFIGIFPVESEGVNGYWELIIFTILFLLSLDRN